MQNKSKLNMILLVIILILLILGLVYFFFNNSKQKENNLPQENQIVNNTQTDCLSTTTSWIKVVSPNGGETYQAGGQIAVKWKSCNIKSNNVAIGFKNITTGNESFQLTAPDNGKADLDFQGFPVGNYKIVICNTKPASAQFEVSYYRDCSVSDYSDNLFTINNKISGNEALAPVMVYKTKANYYNLVPVGLSQDKTQLVSYPAPTDIYYNGILAYPTNLNAGYLLDNRGVGLNSAFLKITYKEYSKLTSVPSLSYLYSTIIDKNPFLELYSCPSGTTQATLNNYINSNQLTTKCIKVI